MEVRQALLVSVLLFVALQQVLSQEQTITPKVQTIQRNSDVTYHDVPVVNEKPKKVIRYKLIRMSDEDIKKDEKARAQKKLHDAQTAMWKKKLFPCVDYSPICSRYKNMWNPGIAQCRDVFMQKNCRETCGLCHVPIGVFLGCNDMQHCKALGSNACVHKWVTETCKTMCGSCDGSMGRKNARVGASSVFVGKKKSIVHTPEKVTTVHEAVKNQHKPLEAKVNPLVKDTNEKEEKVEEDTNASGSSGADEPAEDEQPAKEEKEVETAPKPQEDTPKKEVEAPKVKKVEEPKKPVHHKKHHHHHHKHHHHHHHDKHVKKPKNPVKNLIKKHKKTTKS